MVTLYKENREEFLAPVREFAPFLEEAMNTYSLPEEFSAVDEDTDLEDSHALLLYLRTYGKQVLEEGVGIFHTRIYHWRDHHIFVYLGESMQAYLWIYGPRAAMRELCEAAEIPFQEQE